jgi:tetratricopeptide (TPR) repeat protein
VAALGAASAAALVALGVASLRRAPAVGFAILAGIATYAPTSNLILVSGTLLGERTLYFAALAPAFAAGWIVQSALRDSRWRRAVLLGLAALLVAYGVRTWTRTPFWRDSRTAMIETLLEYPQNYRSHLQFGRHLDLRGWSAVALAEYLIAGALFERDPFVASRSVPLALHLGRSELAVAEAERAWELRPGHPAITGLLVAALQATGRSDSALAVARNGIELGALGYTPAVIYREALRTADAPAWQLALAEARVSWRAGHLAAASATLDSAAAWIDPQADLEGLCWELGELEPVLATLRPDLPDRALEAAGVAGARCEGGLLRQARGLAN